MAHTSQQTTSTDQKLVVMVSSTARDLPEHRNQIKEACLRQGMFPSMMEHLPATDADAIATSLCMVDEADIYLGIFAYRYGYIPDGHALSITEMEYNRAVERGIPRLIFLMDKKHPITIEDIEQGDGMVKLTALKDRLQKERVVNYFVSPVDLHAKVINSLAAHRQRTPGVFHYVSSIPAPPKEYVAHPYTLLQTPSLIGRQQELNLLTDWVSNPRSQWYAARILCIVAIGGMGKSALTWKWFEDIAPNEMQPLAGRMWWSFYESDASFDHFITRALAYTSRRSIEEVQSISRLEREAQLLTILDQQPYLLVLDGLERILLAYACMDAARLLDDDLDQQTANFIAQVQGLPESARESFVGQYRLRKTTDSRIGAFLRKLSTVRASRILVSTRLYPADLQAITGDELPRCKAYFLRGLADDDALNMWRSFGVTGSRDVLVPLFHTFDNHPLLIQVLSGVVARNRSKPGDFDHWRKTHPDFNPFQLPLVQSQSHILSFALRGLANTAQEVLFTIAAFRMPTSYDVLVALFVGEGKLFLREDGLVSTLDDLEDRGLLGWDRRANRYDLHPIVRGITWSRLGKQAKHTIYETLNGYFQALPEIDDSDVQSIDDLAPLIELYNTLIGLERFDEAFKLLANRFLEYIVLNLGIELQAREMLEALFPQGLDQGPHLNDVEDQALVYAYMAVHSLDQVAGAVKWYRRVLALRPEVEDGSTKVHNAIELSYCFIAEQLCLCGSLYEAEEQALQALLFARLHGNKDEEAVALAYLGLALAAQGKQSDSERTFRLVQYESGADRGNVYRGNVYIHLCYAMSSLWSVQFVRVSIVAQRERKVLQTQKTDEKWERLRLRSIWLQCMAALELGNLQEAEEDLLEALKDARELNHVSEEIPIRVGLAELRRRQGNLKAARELLDEVWEPAERGAFRLYHADAYNVLAQIERDAGHDEEAFQAATNAYRLSWCDGPPYAYHYGLQKAKAHLLALHRPEPILPPFDPAGREPLPEVEIDPPEKPRKRKLRKK